MPKRHDQGTMRITKRTFLTRSLTCFIIAAGSLNVGLTSKAESISSEEAHAIAVDAYLYFYPFVTMDITRKQLTNVERVEGIHARMNTFANIPAYPTADMREVVRPNFDTLYSSGCLDLRPPTFLSRRQVGQARCPTTSSRSRHQQLTYGSLAVLRLTVRRTTTLFTRSKPATRSRRFPAGEKRPRP